MYRTHRHLKAAVFVEISHNPQYCNGRVIPRTRHLRHIVIIRLLITRNKSNYFNKVRRRSRRFFLRFSHTRKPLYFHDVYIFITAKNEKKLYAARSGEQGDVFRIRFSAPKALSIFVRRSTETHISPRRVSSQDIGTALVGNPFRASHAYTLYSLSTSPPPVTPRSFV